MANHAVPITATAASPVARFAVAGQRFGIFMILTATILAGAMLVDGFASVGNAANILRSVALVGTVAVGMTLVVISGNFVDLSVPSQVATAAIVVLAFADLNLPLAVLAAITAAGTIGLVNGVLIGVFRANPVIVTLGVQTAAAGLILVATGGAYVYGSSAALRDFGQAAIGPIPIQAFVFLATLTAGQLVLSRTRFGFGLYAIGANRAVARASGIAVTRSIVSVFMAAALLAAVAGVMLAAFANSVNSSAGTGFEFDAMTAVVIGGTSLFGGAGSLWRTLAGVLFIGVVNNLMILVGVAFESQLLVKGSVIVLAVALDALAQRHAGME